MKLLKKDALPLLTLAALWALLHHRILLDGHTFVLMDNSWFFYPVWKWGAEVIRGGWIPLWNPEAGFGTPYLADPQTLSWYPPKLVLYRFFSPTTAFTSLLLGHHLWALAGFWAYARAKVYSRGAAFLGCLVFGFSFNALSLTSIAPMFLAYSWIPWIFWAVEGLREGRMGFGLYLSLVVGSQMASGYPLFTYLTFLAMFLESLLTGWMASKDKHPLRKQAGFAIKIFAAFCAAVLFNAAWILPMFEFIPLSNLPLRLQMPTAPDWGALATWLDPFAQGHPLHSTSKLLMFTDYFCGLPALVLALWVCARNKVNKVPLILFLVFFVLSLGETVKIGGWLKECLPGYQWVVRSGYWIPLVLFLMARITSESSDRFLERNLKPGRDWAWAGSSVIIYLSALWMGVPWELSSFWISLLLVVLAGWKTSFAGAWRTVLLAGAFIFSIGPVLRGTHFTMERAFYEKPPEICSKIAKPGRLYHSPAWTDEFRSLSGNGVGEAYRKPKDLLAPNWPLAFGLEEAVYSNTIFLKPLVNWSYAPLDGSKNSSGKFLDYLGVRYVFGLPVGKGGKSLALGVIPAWENPSAFSRWFSVEEALPEGEWRDDFKKMTGSTFEFSRTSFIKDPSKAAKYQRRAIVEKERVPGRVLLGASGQGQALLVSSEMNYPGWKARVDGLERPLETVNHHFRGIVLSEGGRDIELSYRPMSFRLGVFLSLLACGVWAAMILSTLRWSFLRSWA